MAKQTYKSFVHAPGRPFVVQWTEHSGWRAYHRFATLEQAREVAAEMAGKGCTDVAVWTGNGSRRHPAAEVERFAA